MVYAHTATKLYKVEPATLAQTLLCNPVTNLNNEEMFDLAVRADGVIYVLTPSNLYEVNVGTCRATLRAGLSTSLTFNGMTFTLAGKLIAATTTGEVVEINPTTGAVTTIGDYGGTLGSSGDLVALSNGDIFATATDSANTTADYLVSLNPLAGYAATRIGRITSRTGSVLHTQIYGLGYWAGTLYGFKGNGDVIGIDPTNGFATVVDQFPGTAWYGAGATPKAPIER